ncbi:Requim, req/dpf2 [Theileria orientalis]|uniref:Requim, req/dpf2 n=1 Tax=Theileria orientalis TaxID=68886 RepID=A0A976MD21_THEOR|nr:Requim, req/dpf2 [Theileria orientalis]
MTSLRYFKDEKPEYDPYTQEGTKVSESADSSDSQVNRRETMVNGSENLDEPPNDNEEPHTNYSPNITELFNDLDDDLLYSIDEYLHNGGIKRGFDMVFDDLDETLRKSDCSLTGKRVKRKIKKENDGATTSSGVDKDGSDGDGGNTVAEATGSSWLKKLSKISTGDNSLEEDDVIYITDTTPPKFSDNTTSIDTTFTSGGTVPASLNHEEDLPIKKSRLKIIPDSQRYTSSDNGLVKDEFGFTSEIGASAIKRSCSNTCDHTTCNCSHHHGCQVGCGVCGVDLTGGLFGTSGNNSNGAPGASGITSTMLSTSMDDKSTYGVGEDQHSNVATPRNKFPQSSVANRTNVGSTSGVRTNLSGSYDSDSSEEEEDVDECIICSESMKSELKNEIGVLDVCNHIFCFKCIKMWSDRANLCPLCKREFAHIRKVNLYNIQDLIEKYYLLTNAGTTVSAGIGGNGTVGGSVEVTGIIGGPTSSVDRRENKYWKERRLRCIRKNKISKLKKIISEKINWFDLIPSLKVKVAKKKLQEEEDEGCAICGNDDNWPQLLLCDNCDKGYHMYCLDPPLTEVPANNWYCEQCSNEEVRNMSGEAYDLRRGSAGSGSRSGTTRGRGNRRQNNSNTESTRASRRSTRARTSSRSFLESLLQNQADDIDFRSIGGRSGSGIVSRASLENLIRDSIITISSTMSSPRTHSLNTMIATGTRSRRQTAESQSLEEELRTNLLSQVYMGLNRSMPNATRRATTALRNSIIRRANRTRRNSEMERARSKRGRKSRVSTSRADTSDEISSIPVTIESSLSGRGERFNSMSETINRIDTIEETVRGRSTSITNSILTRDFNPDRVQRNISTALRNNGTRISPYSRIGSDDATTESIKATVKGRLRRFNFNTKNVDQLIQESLESIDNYLAVNTVPTVDIDSISATTSTSTSAFNRVSTLTSAANTLSVPTDVSTATSIPSNTNSAWNAGIADVTGPRSINYPTAITNTTSSTLTNAAATGTTFTTNGNTTGPDGTKANNTTEVRGSMSNTRGNVVDELRKGDIDLLLSDKAIRENITSDNTGPNITSREGTEITQSSDTVARKEKKYTSFIYRYKTITSDDHATSRTESSKQEPYINGKTVKYLF